MKARVRRYGIRAMPAIYCHLETLFASLGSSHLGGVFLKAHLQGAKDAKNLKDHDQSGLGSIHLTASPAFSGHIVS